MFDNKWWLTKGGKKLMSNLVIWSIIFSNSSSAKNVFNVFFKWYKY